MDWFREPTPQQRLLRALLAREAAQKAARFGVGRRAFLGSSMGAMAAMSVAAQATAHASEAEAMDRFVGPSEDAYAEVAERCEGATTFTALAASTAADWELIDQATRAQERGVQDTILNMLRNLGGLYAGFGVDQDVHCRQTATRALRGGASDELVLAGLIHDAGKLISNANHPEIIAAIARPYLSDGAYRVLRHHMEFQWQHYGEFIAKPTDLRDRYVGLTWYEDAAAFSDAYDQRAFDPAYDTLPLEEFEPLVREMFGRSPMRHNRTADDCL